MAVLRGKVCATERLMKEKMGIACSSERDVYVETKFQSNKKSFVSTHPFILQTKEGPVSVTPDVNTVVSGS